MTNRLNGLKVTIFTIIFAGLILLCITSWGVIVPIVIGLALGVILRESWIVARRRGAGLKYIGTAIIVASLISVLSFVYVFVKYGSNWLPGGSATCDAHYIYDVWPQSDDLMAFNVLERSVGDGPKRVTQKSIGAARSGTFYAKAVIATYASLQIEAFNCPNVRADVRLHKMPRSAFHAGQGATDLKGPAIFEGHETASWTVADDDVAFDYYRPPWQHLRPVLQPLIDTASLADGAVAAIALLLGTLLKSIVPDAIKDWLKGILAVATETVRKRMRGAHRG
jgi:hypothetical protein